MAGHIQLAIERERLGAEVEYQMSGVLPYVALKDIDVLVHSPIAVRMKAPAIMMRSAANDPLSGYVIDVPALGYKMFWAHVEDNNYRRSYAAYLRKFCGFTEEAIPLIYDVDHLYNRDRARIYGYRYIRMFPLERGVNRSHGAGYEKAIGRSERLRDVSDRRKMDTVTYLKFMGVGSPRRNRSLSRSQTSQLQIIARNLNISADQLRVEIEALGDKARSGWAAE